MISVDTVLIVGKVLPDGKHGGPSTTHHLTGIRSTKDQPLLDRAAPSRTSEKVR